MIYKKDVAKNDFAIKNFLGILNAKYTNKDKVMREENNNEGEPKSNIILPDSALILFKNGPYSLKT